MPGLAKPKRWDPCLLIMSSARRTSILAAGKRSSIIAPGSFLAKAEQQSNRKPSTVHFSEIPRRCAGNHTVQFEHTATNANAIIDIEMGLHGTGHDCRETPVNHP